MNTNNLVGLMSQARDYDLHRKKISEIMNKNPKILDNKRERLFNVYHSNKGKANQYNFKAKQDNVERQNDFILKKIIDVNNRKTHNSSSSRNLSHNNLLNMKRQTQTINMANTKLAEKLVKTQSLLSQDIVGSTFKKHVQMKGRLTKYAYDEDLGGIVPKKFKSMSKFKRLDPLENSYSVYSKRMGKSRQSEANNPQYH